jgi:hypothetical protein
MAVGMQAIFQRLRGAQCHQPHGDPVDQKVKKNADGSVDLNFAPKPPAGQEANWIPTVAGKACFPFLRFYGLGNSFEVVRGMRMVPFTLQTVVQLAVATLLPVVPLC